MKVSYVEQVSLYPWVIYNYFLLGLLSDKIPIIYYEDELC